MELLAAGEKLFFVSADEARRRARGGPRGSVQGAGWRAGMRWPPWVETGNAPLRSARWERLSRMSSVTRGR